MVCIRSEGFPDEKAGKPGYTGKSPFNFSLSVLFPDDQLMIMDYNRVVKDPQWLHGRGISW